MSVEQFLGLYNYWVVIFLMMTGFYIVIARNNLIKTVIGLNIFQISVILLYVSMGKVSAGTAPIVPPAFVSHGHAEVAHGDRGHGSLHGDGYSVHATQNHSEYVDVHRDEHTDDHDSDKHDDDEHGHDTNGGDTEHEGEAGEDSHDSLHEPLHGNNAIVYSNPLPSVRLIVPVDHKAVSL